MSNVKFEDVGVGNGERERGQETGRSQKRPPSPPNLVFLFLPRLCNLKDEGQSP